MVIDLSSIRTHTHTLKPNPDSDGRQHSLPKSHLKLGKKTKKKSKDRKARLALRKRRFFFSIRILDGATGYTAHAGTICAFFLVSTTLKEQKNASWKNAEAATVAVKAACLIQ